MEPGFGSGLGDVGGVFFPFGFDGPGESSKGVAEEGGVLSGVLEARVEELVCFVHREAHDDWAFGFFSHPIGMIGVFRLLEKGGTTKPGKFANVIASTRHIGLGASWKNL